MKLNHPPVITDAKCAEHLGESPAEFRRRPVEQRLRIAETVGAAASSGTHFGDAGIIRHDARLDDDDFAALAVSRRFAAAGERAKVVAARAVQEAEAAVIAVPVVEQVAELRRQLDLATDEMRWREAASISVAIARLEAGDDLDDDRGQVAP
ncbi:MULTISPECIES: hypothetical protein [Alphaproteobacteria]|uniref:hypothetical protein n=1 Tax=Alphaproteobacteria TaxID=28211 RepID=UPI00326350FE